MKHSRAEQAARWALADVTLLLLASMGGGFLLLPLLIPAHIWAARRSNRGARLGWSLLPAASLGMVTWAAVYALAGEAQPAIWLAPTIVLVVVLVAVDHLASSTPPTIPR